MNYIQLASAIQGYTQNYETDFIANIPVFVEQAELRIYNTVQIPALRRNVTGTASANNKYLSAPSDYLSTFSMAVIDPTTGEYEYLLNKDVNYLRQAYPNPDNKGKPKYYAIFGPQSNNLTELSFIMAPTPNVNYLVELHYYYYPTSIVQNQITSFSSFAGGIGYITGIYNNVRLTGGQGSGAVANLTVSGGNVSQVVLAQGGTGYIPGDILTTSNVNLGGAGSGFAVTVGSTSNPAGASWLGDNFETVLLYGALVEAYTFMKGESDIMQLYNQKYMEALDQLKRLGDGLERQDAYRSGQARVKVN
jgi:hypothetical protein